MVAATKLTATGKETATGKTVQAVASAAEEKRSSVKGVMTGL